MNYKALFILIFLITTCNEVFAQKNQNILTDAEKAKTVKSVGKVINDNYIFPEISEKIVQLLHNKLKSGKYKTINDPVAFAKVLTKDIQSFNGDKHMRVFFEPERIVKQELAISKEDSIALVQDYIKSIKKDNYAFKQVKILEGNIG